MPFFRNYLVLLLALACIAGCKDKKKAPPPVDEPVQVGDFIVNFQPIKLPYQVSDSVFLKEDVDSSLISYALFSQFVPDSVLGSVFDEGSKPEIYPIGKVEIPKEETFLFIKAISGNKKAVFLMCFDKKKQFMNAMVALKPDQEPATLQSVTMDRKYTVTQSVLRKNANGTTSEGKNVYVWDKVKRNFLLIMTDALDEKITELINPIDTLPVKNKFSGDYGSDKLNLVSIRDGRKNDRLSFFVHFEKDKGACNGELMGEAMIRSATSAEYHVAGDPCSLQFNFNSSSVTLKEQGCGSRHGLGCLFDGSFARKKEIKKKK